MEALGRSFVACDASGHLYTIRGYRRHIDVSTGDSRCREYAASALLLETDDGLDVIRIDRGVYEIASQPPVRVSSDDPAAP